MISSPISTVTHVADVAGKWRRIFRNLVPFSRRHRRTFLRGAFAALVVVAARLSIPWLFHEMVRPWFSSVSAGPVSAIGGSQGWQDLLLVGGLLWLIVIILGFADHRERLAFARFSIGTVRDLRAAAFKAAMGGNKRPADSGSAELVARLVGDTARMKAGLKGFLVHVATNGLLYIGGTAVLLVVDVWLGLVFAIAGILIAAGTSLGAVAIFDRALRYRIREGRLALTIQKAASQRTRGSDFSGENRASADLEAAVTRIQGLTTWFAHVVYGAAVVGSLAVGILAIRSGRLSGADLLLFVLYAMTLRAPTVQLARQGARTGKILACGQRLLEILVAGKPEQERPVIMPLREKMELVDVRVKASKSRTAKYRLGPLDLQVEAHQHIMLVGKEGSGKTTLLDVLAGQLSPARGKVYFDGVQIEKPDRKSLADHVLCVRQACTWYRQPLRNFLGITEAVPSEATVDVLKRCRAWPHIRSLIKKLDTKVFSSDFSRSQRVSLSLARALLLKPSILLIDDPFVHLSRIKKETLIGSIMQLDPELTLVYACRRPVAADLFDRVVQLEKGRIVFDDVPAAFLDRIRKITEPNT